MVMLVGEEELVVRGLVVVELVLVLVVVLLVLVRVRVLVLVRVRVWELPPPLLPSLLFAMLRTPQ